MQNIFVEFLPPWVETGLQPAFYDKESGTVLQQVARMYAKVNYLVKLFNDFNSDVTKIVNEYIEEFTELKNFVNDYFDNLDVQEEINNKLDAMTEDGTLQEIITAYIQANVAWTFDTVADMKLATNLIEGSFAQTIGFHNKNDGGGATYKIVATGTANEMDLIAINNNLFAELVYDNVINVKQLGAYGDSDHDDDDPINRAIDLGKTVFIPNGEYIVGDVIDLPNFTEIIGEDYHETIISKSIVSSPNAIFRFTGSGKVKIRNIGLECNNLTDYGIIATTNISYFELSDIKVNQPITAGFYFDHSTYLGTINRCIVANTDGHGFYIVPSNPSNYFNTSININNCYTTECSTGYAINGSYMNMENCACDGANDIAYDLRGFVGSLVSCGSESYHTQYTFYGDSGTMVSVINAKTFGSYDLEDSVHIFTGVGSDWIFIGGNLGYRFRSSLSSGLGRFLEQSDGSHVKFIGTRIRGVYSKPNIIKTALEIDDYYGNVINKGDMVYLGYNQGNVAKAFGNEMPASAIYLGSNNEAYVSKNEKSTNTGVNAGDMFITKTPVKVNGAGWISNTDKTGRVTSGEYYKIPIVHNCATTDAPRRGLVVGDMYYDTTLNQPRWCTNVGRQQDETVYFTTAPVSDGTITFTFMGTDYPIDATAGMTKSELYQAMVNANIEGVLLEEYNNAVHCVAKDYRNFGGSKMFTIDVGTTGAVIADNIQITGAGPTWKSLSEFTN